MEIGRGLIPLLAAEGVMAQGLHVLGEAVREEPFDGVNDPGVDQAAPLLEEAPVGYLVRQGVLKRIFAFGEQPCLIEKLGGL